MRKIIIKTFGLRDDEIRISFLMLLYIFIVITVLLIVKPTVNAIFVSELGADKLPFGYLMVAGVAVLTSYFYNKAIRKFSLVKVTVLSIITFSLIFLVLSAVLKLSLINDVLLYFYYVFISLFAVVATSQFWLFANMVYNAREAKRNFGFIGAGAIAGGIFGGYLTSIIAVNFGNEYVILLAALLLLLCIPILKQVYQLRIKYLNSFKRKQVIAKKDTLESSSLQLIRKSKHLTYIALITGIGVIVAKLVDFQFSDFANKTIPNSDDLAAFFGFWFSTFNLVALTVQLFLTNKILTKLGVSTSLLVLPLAIAFGSLLFLTFPELWVLILIKGIDGSAKQSLNKSAIELSIMPIPLLVKNQAKSYIDVVIDSIATGFAGFLLIFLIKKLNLETSYITVIILLLTFIWILFIYRLREAYFNSFKKNIQRNITVEDDKKNKKSENTIADVKYILENGDEDSILSLFDRLKDYDQKTFNKQIIQLLDHPSNTIKIQAISFLDSFKNQIVLNKVKDLIYEEDDVLVYIALDYLLANSPEADATFFNKYLDHENEYISNGALLTLAKQSFNNTKLASKYSLVKRIEEKIELISANSNTKEEVIAGLLMSIAYARLTKYYKYIHIYLKSNNNYLVKFAAISASISSDEVFISDLLDLINVKKHRRRAVKTLKNYGPKIIDILLTLEKNGKLNNTVRKHVPKVIRAFNNKQALKILFRLLRSRNSVIRLEASKAIKKLTKRNKQLYISSRMVKNSILRESNFYKNLLDIISSIQHQINEDLIKDESIANQELYKVRKSMITSLEKTLNQNLSCIFNLLSLIYNEDDINMTYTGIKSEIKEARINSIEFLDNILQNKIKLMVLPVIENYIIDNKIENSNLKLKILSEQNFLKRVLRMGDVEIKILALTYIKVAKNKNFKTLLLPLKKFKNDEIRELATETYHSYIGNH